MSIFSGKTLMITGGTGSFGNAVLSRFLRTDIEEIRIFSRDEKKQDDMRHMYQVSYPDVFHKIKFYIGDVRSLESCRSAMPGTDYIFHAAALKQVPSCEFFQLKINDYVLSLHLHKSTEKRNRQTVELVERSGLKYNVVNVRSIPFLNRLALLFCYEQKFNRVFLGTHLYQNGYYYALKEIKNGGNLVLLDDGVATLTLLESGYKVTGRSVVQMAINKAIASLRRIKLNNLLSVYKGIANQKWDIAYNDLSFLRNNNSTSSNKVFFIGTNNSSAIYKDGVDEFDYKQNLYNILNKMRLTYPNDEITYIPHGRDKSTFAKDFCEIPLTTESKAEIDAILEAPVGTSIRVKDINGTEVSMMKVTANMKPSIFFRDKTKRSFTIGVEAIKNEL